MKESMPQSIKSPSVFTIQDTIKRMEERNSLRFKMRKFYGSEWGYSEQVSGKFCSGFQRLKLMNIIIQLYIHGLNTTDPNIRTHIHMHTHVHRCVSTAYLNGGSDELLFTFRKPSF